MGDGPLPTWTWSESELQRILNRARAGRSLRPQVWPGGARCAVALSFDSDHDTFELRDGGKSISALSQGHFGARQGVPRISALLARHGIPATFFVPAVTALHYPEEQRALAQAGYEIALHGWIHERNTLLDPATERDLALRAAETLESITGRRPVGIRTPSWDFSEATLAISLELGLEYDSSLMADVDCYELLLDGKPTGLIELPVEWIRDDAAYLVMDRWGGLRPQISPSDILDIFRREFDAAFDEGGLFQLTMHPDIIGHRSRLWLLDELVQHARARGSVWFATHADVVRHVRASCF